VTWTGSEFYPSDKATLDFAATANASVRPDR